MSYTIVGGVYTIDRDPHTTLRYGFDVRDRLASGDSIASVSISAQAGVTADQPTFAGTAVQCRVTGGTVGQPASVTLRWVTAQGDTDEQSISFRVVQR
jgi:hypothetical protein